MIVTSREMSSDSMTGKTFRTDALPFLLGSQRDDDTDQS